METDMPTENKVSETFKTQPESGSNSETTSSSKVVQSFAPGTDAGSGRQGRSSVFRNPKVIVATLLVLLVAVAGFLIVNRKPALVAVKQSAAVVTVTVENVQLRPLNRRLTVNGSISAWDPLLIGSEIAGLRIDQVNVDEGQNVRKGQIMAVLNSSVLRAQLETTKATLNAANASLRKAIQPNRIEDIHALMAARSQSQAAVLQEEQNLAQAKANLENARQNAIRYGDLLSQGAVSTQDTETRQMNLQIAQASVNTAEQRINAAKFAAQQASERLLMAQRGGRVEDVQIARANTKQIEADIKRQEAQIAQTIIRAPDDGLIIKRDAHLGEITTIGKPLFTMVRAGRLELRAQVAESDLLSIHPGQAVRISASANNGTVVTGHVREISPLVDTSSRLGTLRIDVPASAGFIPGMFVHAEVELGQSNSLALPAKAIVSRDGQTFVFTLEANDRVKMQAVQTGATTDNLIEVISGLSPGQTVIIEGAGFLKDGDTVRVSR